jgi:hypothetical protein
VAAIHASLGNTLQAVECSGDTEARMPPLPAGYNHGHGAEPVQSAAVHASETVVNLAYC